MSKLFSPDNGFFTVVNKIIDIIVISFLWGLTSILLFTMGPSTCAAYYTMVKVIRRERSHAVTSYFHSFKDNFKQGSLAALIFWIYAVVAYLDLRYAAIIAETEPTAGKVLSAVFITVSIFMSFLVVWVFPILSRFTLPFKNLMKNSLLIAIRHFPVTFAMVAMIGAELWLVYNYVPIQFYLLVMLVLPSLSLLVRSFLIEPVLKKYMPEAEGSPEETGQDQWYRE